MTTNFPQGPERNRAFGVYAAVSGAGAAIGLIMGGVLTDLLSWRWVFFVNAPIGIALAIAAPYVIAEAPRAKSGALDFPGALTSTGGMAALVYGFIHAATNSVGLGDHDPVVRRRRRAADRLRRHRVAHANPIMPLRLFRSRTRVGSYVVMTVLGAAVFAMFYFLTQYVQQVLGYSPLKAGFAFLPVSAVIVVVAQFASRIVARLGAQTLIVSGTILTGFGLLLLSTLTVDSSYLLHVLPAIALIATGMGFVFVPITLTAVGGVAPADSGIASAMLNVCQQVGGTIGLSALVTVFSIGARHDAEAQRRHACTAPRLPSTPSPMAPIWLSGPARSLRCSAWSPRSC